MHSIDLQKTISPYIEQIENLISERIKIGNLLTINLLYNLNEDNRLFDNLTNDTGNTVDTSNNYIKVQKIDSLIQELFKDIWKEIGLVYDEWAKNEAVKKQKEQSKEDVTFERSRSLLIQKQIEDGLSQYQTQDSKYKAIKEISDLLGAESAMGSETTIINSQADITTTGKAEELPED